MLPEMMLIGVSEERFWNSTVRKLKPYGEYYKKRQYELDSLAHKMGAYVYEAVGTALVNAFSKSGTKGYRERPYLYEQEEERRIEHMTEEEKTEKVEEIFSMLAGGTV